MTSIESSKLFIVILVMVNEQHVFMLRFRVCRMICVPFECESVNLVKSFLAVEFRFSYKSREMQHFTVLIC